MTLNQFQRNCLHYCLQMTPLFSFQVDNLPQFVNVLNDELIKLYDWLCMIRLTNYMVFHRARIKDTKLLFKGKVLIHSDLIKQLYHTKFLGVINDSKLNWSKLNMLNILLLKSQKGSVSLIKPKNI